MYKPIERSLDTVTKAYDSAMYATQRTAVYSSLAVIGLATLLTGCPKSNDPATTALPTFNQLNIPVILRDGIDNDGDGLTDMADPDAARIIAAANGISVSELTAIVKAQYNSQQAAGSSSSRSNGHGHGQDPDWVPPGHGGDNPGHGHKPPPDPF